MNSQVALQQRWATFINKIKDRFTASLQDAEEACVEQLYSTDYDYYTVMRSWQGIKAQLYELGKKVEDVWCNQVEHQMKAVGDFWMDENTKVYELIDLFSLEIGRFERELEGKLSQLFYDHTMENATKEIACTQCNGTIPVLLNVFRAQYLSCSYCQSVNTFEPETKFHLIGWNIVDNIAKQKSVQPYREMKEAYATMHKQRLPISEEYWDRYKKAYLAYYDHYFKERIKLNAEAEARYEADMARKVKEFENYKKISKS